MAQTLGGVVVGVGDRLLSLVSVAPDAIVALLPSDLDTGEARLAYRNASGQELNTAFQIVRNAPALFPETLRHEDGSPITADSPALPGELLTVSGTGFGPLLFPVVDGFPTPESPVNPVADPVSVNVGSQSAALQAAVAEAGFSGRIRLRFRLPGDLSGASADLSVTVGEAVSNTLQVPVTNP
jgi:uncharacterized protein (TIGR03437 family)